MARSATSMLMAGILVVAACGGDTPELDPVSTSASFRSPEPESVTTFSSSAATDTSILGAVTSASDAEPAEPLKTVEGVDGVTLEVLNIVDYDPVMPCDPCSKYGAQAFTGAVTYRVTPLHWVCAGFQPASTGSSGICTRSSESEPAAGGELRFAHRCEEFDDPVLSIQVRAEDSKGYPGDIVLAEAIFPVPDGFINTEGPCPKEWSPTD